MTCKDWLCPICCDVMMSTPSGYYMVCEKAHWNGLLHRKHGLVDLPQTLQINSRDFHIRGIPHNRYQYVAHGHKTALDKAPPEGCVVASVAFRGHRAVRLLRRKRTLKDRLGEHYFQKLGEAAEK